ncbi:MAG TPA: transcription antitermination factor NusB [Bryobacteraceae bacterium]|nr:transcription antitermination factor NusB [Bryobacteraceae bacterium]
MSSRRRSREHALQILYQWDMRKQPIDDSLDAFYSSLYSEESPVRPERDPFLEDLVRGTVDKSGEIDALISSHAEHWRIERMPAVDRNILRLAIFELRHTGTPPAVVIDEALELARRFSNEESVHFVNGVLDAVHREAAGSAG